MAVTKLELQQRLDVALRENEALRLEVAQLKATLEVRARAAAANTKVRTVATPTVAPEMLRYREYRDACKVRAMQGHVVRVKPFVQWLAEGSPQTAEV